MTLGQTKNVDILVSDPRTNKFCELEVKTKLDSRKQERDTESRLFGRIVGAWIMNRKHECVARPSLWYCFVMIAQETKVCRFFLLPSKVVAEYVRAQHQLWLKQENTAHNETLMRNLRIGRKGETYKIPTPTAEQYEDNWEFRE